MAIREGKWDCSACGTTGVRGPETRCMACGAPRPADVHFYLSSDAPVVADPDAIARARAGVDWRCSSCEASNKAWDTHCSACGNPKEASDTHYRERDAVKAAEGYRASTSARARQRSDDASLRGWERQRRDQRRKLKLGLLGIMVVVGLVCSGLVGRLFLYESYDAYRDGIAVEEAVEHRARLLAQDRCSKRIARVPVEVSEHRWQRYSHWERYVWVGDSGWSTPSGARNVSSRQKIHHYVTVFDGYETETYYETETVGTETYVCGQRSLGNGYFEDKTCTRSKTERVRKTREVKKYREDPVYQTYYSYEVQRWIKQGDLKAKGVGLERYWEATPMSGSDVRRIDTREDLQVVIVEHDVPSPRDWTLELDEEAWLALVDGELHDYGVDGCGTTYGLLAEVN